MGGHRAGGEGVAARPSSGGVGGAEGSPLPSGLGASEDDRAVGPSYHRNLKVFITLYLKLLYKARRYVDLESLVRIPPMLV